jgi:hypothetical protein
MLDLVDLLLLRRSIPADDRALTFRRIDGNAGSTVLYFLPWHTPFGMARQFGIAPLDFLACYEMPAAIVSSEPEMCVRALLDLVADAEQLLAERGVAGKDAVIIGLSVGSYPAPIGSVPASARLRPRIAPTSRSGRVLQRASSNDAPCTRDTSLPTTPKPSLARIPHRTSPD